MDVRKPAPASLLAPSGIPFQDRLAPVVEYVLPAEIPSLGVRSACFMATAAWNPCVPKCRLLRVIH
jgi:hypothetical protein